MQDVINKATSIFAKSCELKYTLQFRSPIYMDIKFLKRPTMCHKKYFLIIIAIGKTYQKSQHGKKTNAKSLHIGLQIQEKLDNVSHSIFLTIQLKRSSGLLFQTRLCSTNKFSQIRSLAIGTKVRLISVEVYLTLCSGSYGINCFERKLLTFS